MPPTEVPRERTGEVDDGAADGVWVVDVGLEGALAAVRPACRATGHERRVVLAAREPAEPRPRRRTERARQRALVGRREVPDSLDPERAQTPLPSRPHAGQHLGTQRTNHSGPACGVEPDDPARLREPARHLGLQLVVADPDGAGEAGRLDEPPLDRRRKRARIVRLRLEVRLVPARDLPPAGNRAERLLDLARCGPVRGRVERQEDGVGAAASRRPQRHPGVDAERTCLVGGARDHSTPRRIAARADDHRPPSQLRTAPQFDRHDELVDVHEQDRSPTGRVRPGDRQERQLLGRLLPIATVTLHGAPTPRRGAPAARAPRPGARAPLARAHGRARG